MGNRLPGSSKPTPKKQSNFNRKISIFRQKTDLLRSDTSVGLVYHGAAIDGDWEKLSQTFDRYEGHTYN